MDDATGSSASRPSLSVLIVEDEFLIAMDIEGMLTSNGHDVVGTAPTVAAGLRLLETLRPDVAVLDGNLRGEVVTPVALRLQDLRVPFVLASAYAFAEIDGCGVLAAAMNVGKPVDEGRLLVALHQAVANG